MLRRMIRLNACDAYIRRVMLDNKHIQIKVCDKLEFLNFIERSKVVIIRIHMWMLTGRVRLINRFLACTSMRKAGFQSIPVVPVNMHNGIDLEQDHIKKEQGI